VGKGSVGLSHHTLLTETGQSNEGKRGHKSMPRAGFERLLVCCMQDQIHLLGRQPTGWCYEDTVPSSQVFLAGPTCDVHSYIYRIDGH
jgi:hypothetical protein